MDKQRETSKGRREFARSALTKFCSHLDARPGKVTLPRRVIELFDVLSVLSRPILFLSFSRFTLPADSHLSRSPKPPTSSSATFLSSFLSSLLCSARRDRLPGCFGDLLITRRGEKKKRKKRGKARWLDGALETGRVTQRSKQADLCRLSPFFFLSFSWCLCWRCWLSDVRDAVMSATRRCNHSLLPVHCHPVEGGTSC